MLMKPKIYELLIVLLFCLCTVFGTSSAASPDVDEAIQSALDYIAAAQVSGGGFAESNMIEGSIGTTWFVVTAISAAGEDPQTWKVNDTSPLDYWNSIQDDADGTGEMAKKITYLVQFGVDPHDYNGHNYVTDLKSKVKSSGEIGDFIYTTYWGIFGLVAAGEDVSKSVAWLKQQQQDDGGFAWAEGGVSDSDDTAASIMALIAGGVSPNDQTISSAVQYLRDVQEPSGGFNYGYYSESNLASTAWVIQALAACGIDPSTVTKNGNSPVDYLLSLQQADGSFKYTEYVVDSPVSMTARAVTALTGKSYPILPLQTGYEIKSSAYTDITSNPQIPTSTPEVTTTPTYTTPLREWEPVTIIDDYGYTITITEEPSRIISLAPANTEILFALGLNDSIVGVTEYCNYPEEATTKPIIGGYTTVNVERVITQNPDLIFAYYGNGEDLINHLRYLGYTVITLNSDSIEGTLNDIALIGQATGKTTEADELVDSMQSRIDAVKEKLKDVTTAPRTIHCMWTDPLWVSGNNTFQDEMIKIAGGENAFGNVEGWGVVTLEKLLTTDPEIIIVDSGMGMGEGGTDILKNYFKDETRLQGLSAVKNNQIYVINADIMDRGGPRIADCIETLARIQHPEIFGAQYDVQSSASSPGFIMITTITAVCGLLFYYRKR
ncbi:Vitamin B12-binding protein [bioreactor metagenome]|uniref:Vitamin B12-binding protein n=1 Tax=bioreactor metagenome TaxID=1076179 RepID=A0A644U6K0_9ZZZZ|nr:helical backbone metal receptor [Methanocorpusculum sp.]